MKFWKYKHLSLSFAIRLLAFIAFGIISVSVTFAASPGSIIVDVLPPNPAPFESTTINLNSYENNLDSVFISWSENGKTVLSGVGKKSFIINAPAAGLETSVIATISLPEGAIDTRVTIRPSVMVLLWQANDSHVPPFYRGKALPTPDSEIKVVAMPEIRTPSGASNPKNMTYSWEKDYTNVAEDSGYGKNFFLFTNDYLEGSNNINVVASTVDQKYSSESSIDVGTIQPKILFYKDDNILGTIWEHALPGTHSIEGDEVVMAIPYFISPKEIRNPRLVWNWSINGNAVNILGYKKNLMPLQASVGTHGTAKLGLEIENKDKIFQTTSKEMNIEF